MFKFLFEPPSFGFYFKQQGYGEQIQEIRDKRLVIRALHIHNQLGLVSLGKEK